MKKTVFIIQDTEGEVNQIKKALTENSYEVVGEATNGLDGLSGVLRTRPDIVVTELILAGIDGLAVIERILSQFPSMKIFVVSSLSKGTTVVKAMSKGATFFMAKPLECSLLIERINELVDSEDNQEKELGQAVSLSLSKKTLEEKVSKIFISIGIPPHIKGYAYLREGVKLSVKDPDLINNITKKLYPAIGEIYRTTASKVERAIRHAIEVAWNRGRIECINAIFGVRAYVGSEKPTNGEFIALVADKMLLEGER